MAAASQHFYMNSFIAIKLVTWNPRKEGLLGGKVDSKGRYVYEKHLNYAAHRISPFGRASTPWTEAGPSPRQPFVPPPPSGLLV